jgi:kinesin family protein 6/9
VNIDLPRSTGSQQDVFDVVAVPVVDSVLDGYNATIFAYGQTGSGKTFTITGGAERYNDRGIIPRVLTHLFEQFAKRSERVFEAKVCWIALVFAFAS